MVLGRLSPSDKEMAFTLPLLKNSGNMRVTSSCVPYDRVKSMACMRYVNINLDFDKRRFLDMLCELEL